MSLNESEALKRLAMEGETATSAIFKKFFHIAETLYLFSPEYEIQYVCSG